MSDLSPIAPLLLTDGYKLDHRRQYPAGTTAVYSNYTNRASRIEGVDKVVHFGLQAFCRRYLMEAWDPFFQASEDEVCHLYETTVTNYLGPNSIGTDHIRALHRLGYLPLRISSLPEGTMVPLRIPSFTIENTHPDFFWLVNYIETAVSAAVWHPSTTATIAAHYRDILEDAAARTGVLSQDVIDFQAHDFSSRGQSSLESAAASGAAHLLSFAGTDSLMALDWIKSYYPGDQDIAAASVPATEHSVMCAGGQADELETYVRLLTLYPEGIVSIVSDTWDFWNVLEKIIPQLRDHIVTRNGKLVIRPDSGDPEKILCGDPGAPRKSPEYKGAVEVLGEKIGYTINDYGYRELDQHIGLIYGDSITPERARSITAHLEEKGWASTNVVFGVGSYTYQYVTRDTFSSAIKATWVAVDGKGRSIQKDPATDTGMKKSARGRLAVVSSRGEMTLIEEADPAVELASLIRPVWKDGHFLVEEPFSAIRSRLAAQRADRPRPWAKKQTYVPF